jgi:hypothetical protein
MRFLITLFALLTISNAIPHGPPGRHHMHHKRAQHYGSVTASAPALGSATSIVTGLISSVTGGSPSKPTATGYHFPTLTSSSIPVSTPTPEPYYCTLGSIFCNSTSTYSICVPSVGSAFLGNTPSSVRVSMSGSTANGILLTDQGDHLQSMGNIPYKTQCLNGQIFGIYGSECSNTGDIFCEGGLNAWSVCVGGYKVSMGNLQGGNKCVDGSLLGPLNKIPTDDA